MRLSPCVTISMGIFRATGGGGIGDDEWDAAAAARSGAEKIIRAAATTARTAKRREPVRIFQFQQARHAMAAAGGRLTFFWRCWLVAKRTRALRGRPRRRAWPRFP